MDRRSTWLTVGAVTVTGVLAYAAYFDYKRRNDVTFRKKLRKQQKKVEKAQASSRDAAAKGGNLTAADLTAALDKVKQEEVPATPEEKEQYFMGQVSMGEALVQQGPLYALEAALCFYRALRVYPSPVELIVIYQKTMPESIFKIVMELTQLDIQDRVESYYDVFPPARMHVKVSNLDIPDNGKVLRKKILVAAKDIEAGEVIYTEQPVVAALDYDLLAAQTHCNYCLRLLPPINPVRPDGDVLEATFCSQVCKDKSYSQSQALLFAADPGLPTDVAAEMSPEALEDRKSAQTRYAENIKKSGRAAPLLAARFVAQQISTETVKLSKMASGSSLPKEWPEAEGGDYNLSDYIERYRYLEYPPSPDQVKLLSEVLALTLPGLESFVTDESQTIIVGKMAYNSFGVVFGAGRDDKPASLERPEDVEKTRTQIGTDKQVGSAFYLVSAYLNHSCDPAASISFPSLTTELTLTATRKINAGDEITVSYVDSSQRAGESLDDSRRRRRAELARGWRFACGCTRCLSELNLLQHEVTEELPPSLTDESKVESKVERVDDLQ